MIITTSPIIEVNYMFIFYFQLVTCFIFYQILWDIYKCCIYFAFEKNDRDTMITALDPLN